MDLDLTVKRLCIVYSISSSKILITIHLICPNRVIIMNKHNYFWKTVLLLGFTTVNCWNAKFRKNKTNSTAIWRSEMKLASYDFDLCNRFSKCLFCWKTDLYKHLYAIVAILALFWVMISVSSIKESIYIVKISFFTTSTRFASRLIRHDVARAICGGQGRFCQLHGTGHILFWKPDRIGINTSLSVFVGELWLAFRWQPPQLRFGGCQRKVSHSSPTKTSNSVLIP